MEKKDLLAQNSEQENESKTKAKAPSKKRTTRKKTDSQKASDAQNEKETPSSCDVVSNENIQDDVKDALSTQIESEAAASDSNKVSSSEKESEATESDVEELPPTESENEIVEPTESDSSETADESKDQKAEDCEEDCEFDFIPTPDEIFATLQFENEPIEETEAEVSETSETEEIEDEVSEADETEESEEDIQYSFTNIEPDKTENTNALTKDLSPKKYNPLKPRRIDKFFDFIELVAFTLLAVMILTSFVFRHSIVDGESMENTLHSSEHLIISDLFYTPDRGDIIVCEDYTTSIPKPIVKRVIAIEGDTVKITSDGKVYVNGQLIDESRYVYIDDLGYEYKELELTVPKNEIFVMGDHRNKSTDSREIGTVSEDSVLGKVLLRFYPFNKFGKVD